MKEGTERAFADFSRFRDDATLHWAEPSLVDRYLHIDAPDQELVDRLVALHNLPAGTLGWEYIEFYRRQDLQLPGQDLYIPAFFVAHDMNHVIAGYHTTGQEETALSAMILGMADTDDHWVLMLTSVAAYELGLHSTAAFVGKHDVFACEGAASLIVEALRRGARAPATSPRSTTSPWPTCPSPKSARCSESHPGKAERRAACATGLRVGSGW